MTDHYSDARDRHESRIIQDRADRNGLTYNQQVEKDLHDQKMEQGRRAYQKRKIEDELISYFKEHSSEI